MTLGTPTTPSRTLTPISDPQKIIIKSSKIDFKITPKIDIKSTKLIVKLKHPSNILAGSKEVANYQPEYSVEIDGRSMEQIATLEAVRGVTGGIAAVASNTSRTVSVAVLFGSIFGGSVMFMMRFLQVTEFYAMFIFFNVKYSFVVDSILLDIYTSLNGEKLTNPINDYNMRPIDHAWVYKGKLSEYLLPPFLFQNSSLGAFVIIILYTLTPFVIGNFRKAAGWKYYFFKLRMTLFFCFLMDILVMSLRTLGHFSVANKKLLTWNDWLSIAGSVFFLVMLTIELLAMFYMDEYILRRLTWCNDKGMIFKWRSLYKIYYELTVDDVCKTGMIAVEDQVKNIPILSDRFCRNYNSLSIGRLYVMIALYVGMQNYPLIQISVMIIITGIFLG